MDDIVKRLRADAAYARERVGATVRQIGRDCDEAADRIEALQAQLDARDAPVRQIEGAMLALSAYQQADMDGVTVLTSRQAIEEILTFHRAMIAASEG